MITDSVSQSLLLPVITDSVSQGLLLPVITDSVSQGLLLPVITDSVSYTESVITSDYRLCITQSLLSRTITDSVP